MSFGFGIGDILAVSKLAYEIYGRIQDASDQFRAIRTEFRGLSIVLDDAALGLPGQTLNQKHADDLKFVMQACQGVLDDTNAVLEKFEKLGVQSATLKAMTRKTWQKVTWDKKSIQDLRDRIISNTTLLNTLNASVAREAAQSTNESTNDKVTVLDGRVQNLQSHSDDQERQKILDCISLLTFSSQQSAILGQRQEGTGKWLLESKEFQEWMSSSRATLHCIGMPGAGKTMLVSIAVDYLINKFRARHDVAIAYIYCDYKTQSEQTPLNLTASLLRQLLRHQHSVSEHVRELYTRHRRKGTAPNLEEIVESFHLTAANFSQIYIVVDALDELQQRGNMPRILLSRLRTLQVTENVNLMITSRDIPHLVAEVKNAVMIEVRASEEDVIRYVDGHIDELPRFVSRNQQLQQNIKDAIVPAVDGMFLLARLHLESLADRMSPGEVRKALETLPEGKGALSVAYDQAMRRIEAQKPGMRYLAQKTLSWITYAKRHLTVVELRHALAIQQETADFDEENLSDIEDIVSACGGLVIIDTGPHTDTIRLVHYSTQKFLRQTGDEYFPGAQQSIAVSCLTYVLYDAFQGGWQSRIRYVAYLEQQYPFLAYVAQHWASHAGTCLEQPVRDTMMQFLKDDYKVSNAMQVLMSVFPRSWKASWRNEFLLPHSNSRDGRPFSGMHLAAFLGVKDIVTMLLNSGFAADTRDEFNRSPLFWAALKGHAKVVEVLLSINDKESDVESRNDNRLPSLALNGNWKNEAQFLVLPEGANSNAAHVQDPAAQTSRATSDKDRTALGTLTPSYTVDVNCLDRSGYTPLAVAIRGGHEAVVQLLLSCPDTEVNIASGKVWPPLKRAVRSRHEGIIKLLLARHDIDVNSKTKNGTTALSSAARLGWKAGVALLMNSPGIDMNTKDDDGYTPLSLAAYVWNIQFHKPYFNHTEYEAVVKLLLTRPDVDVDCIDKKGISLLTRVTKYAQERSDSKFDGIIAMLRTAMEERSGATREA